MISTNQAQSGGGAWIGCQGGEHLLKELVQLMDANTQISMNRTEHEHNQTNQHEHDQTYTREHNSNVCRSVGNYTSASANTTTQQACKYTSTHVAHTHTHGE